MELVLIALSLFGVALLVWIAAEAYLRLARAELRRGSDLEAFAVRNGLSYSRLDPAFPAGTETGLPFELFSRGVGQRCENVMRGTYDGCDLRAFDFWYSNVLYGTQQRDGRLIQTETARSPVGRGCAVATFAADCPHLIVTRESHATRALADAGVRDIELESGDFNDVFRVAAPERKFASDFLDARMMQWLLDNGRHWDWEVQRGYILCSGPLLRGGSATAMLAALAGVHRRIPRTVYALHGTAV